MNLSDRIGKLGPETAFAVSAEAQAFAAQGNKVYPLHIGDINIRTPDNIIEAAHKAMKDGKTGYVPNAGIPALREAIAADINKSHGTSYGIANVAIQPGGKPTIGKFIQTLMNPGDEVLYPNPGYPIYESQIEFHGGKAVPYGFIPGKENFGFDMEALERAVTPRTRLLIVNDLQNPTGAEASEEELRAIAAFAVKHDLYVLADEAYFDMRFSAPPAGLVSMPGMVDRSVILYTFSKKYAMTGWRLGASIGPQPIIDVIAKLNLNDESCTNGFVQYAGIEALTGDQSGSRGSSAS
jgi:aspartate/methionine/tyrosine aminotransferase